MSLFRLSIPAWKIPCGLRVTPYDTISNVAAGSVAEKAGCNIGDKIVSVDDVPTIGRRASSVFHLLSSRKAGDTVIIEVRRSGKADIAPPESSQKSKASSSRKRKADEALTANAPAGKAAKSKSPAAGKAPAKSRASPASKAPAAAETPPAAAKQVMKRNPTPKLLTKWPKELRFRDYTNPDENLRISKLELKLMKLCGAIRNKKGWVQKLSDPSITSKWMAEAASQFGLGGKLSSQATVLALDELRWQAGEAVLPGGVEGTFAADDALPEALHDRLVEGFATLASGPKDWHPGSNKQVLDLVHPSLFCLERGVTPELKAGCKMSTLPHKDASRWAAFLSGISAKPEVKQANGSDSSWPPRWASPQGLAWLPAEFALSADGKRCDILTYINNLDPSEHSALYGVIGECFVCVAPLLEAVLSGIAETEMEDILSYVEAPRSHRRPHLPVGVVKERYKESKIEYYGGSDDEYEREYEREYDHPSDAGQPIPPKLPNTFQPPPRPPCALSLRGRQLQVVVKLASIRLTPEAPTYEGGSWHVEGMADEAIVATAIYYTSCENTTPSSLAFRQAHSNYVPSAQHYHDEDGAVYDVYGLSNGMKLVQTLGTCSTIERRALAFPNTLQHRVNPFELVDKTKPGQRDILVFFLVDPTRRITSTSSVPPQQASWRAGKSSDTKRGAIGMSYTDACTRRQRLMTERGLMTKRTVDLFEQTFSLCEH